MQFPETFFQFSIVFSYSRKRRLQNVKVTQKLQLFSNETFVLLQIQIKLFFVN